jgi:hypothetical protein
MIKAKDGSEKVPAVHFRAEDSAQDEIKSAEEGEMDEMEAEGLKQMQEEGSEKTMVDGKLIKLGKIENSEEKMERIANVRKEMKEKEKEKAEDLEFGLRGGPGEGGVESYSGEGREKPSSSGPQKFVRWSSSTEIGDFIRDAARGKEFAVEIEGSSSEIRVGVPSFNDRTHYLRVRLRKTSGKLADLASVKKEV